MRRLGFTVLEVLIALSILTLSLTAIYQTYGTALFSLTTTDTLWRVMSHIQNRLLFHDCPFLSRDIRESMEAAGGRGRG